LIPGSYSGIAPNAPAGTRFPTPPLAGGPDAAQVVVRGGRRQDGSPRAEAQAAPTGKAADTIFVKGVGYVPVDKRATSAADPQAKAKDARKASPKIDPAALEKVLAQPAGAR
jgi:hypothetical protein